MHKFYSPIKYNGMQYLAVVSVEEYYNDAVKGISRRGYNLKAIEIEPGNGHFGETPTAPVLQSGSIKNISQLFNFVKRFDKDFHPHLYNCQ